MTDTKPQAESETEKNMTSATYADIRASLEKAVKSAPMLPAPPAWKQSGWTLSFDGALRDVDAPLVSVRLFEVWTKVLQQRQNGWDGESFYVRAMFDGTKTASEVAAYLDAQFRSALSHSMTEFRE